MSNPVIRASYKAKLYFFEPMNKKRKIFNIHAQLICEIKMYFSVVYEYSMALQLVYITEMQWTVIEKKNAK